MDIHLGSTPMVIIACVVWFNIKPLYADWPEWTTALMTILLLVALVLSAIGDGFAALRQIL